MRKILLSELTRREVENLLLTEHQLLGRVLEVVRKYAKPEWKLSREVDRVLDQTLDQRPIRATYVRAFAGEADERDAKRNEERWDKWGG